MQFDLSRTSEWLHSNMGYDVDMVCVAFSIPEQWRSRVTLVRMTDTNARGGEYVYYIPRIQLFTLEELVEFSNDVGHNLVVSENHIEIYDDYRE